MVWLNDFLEVLLVRIDADFFFFGIEIDLIQFSSLKRQKRYTLRCESTRNGFEWEYKNDNVYKLVGSRR